MRKWLKSRRMTPSLTVTSMDRRPRLLLSLPPVCPCFASSSPSPSSSPRPSCSPTASSGSGGEDAAHGPLSSLVPPPAPLDAVGEQLGRGEDDGEGDEEAKHGHTGGKDSRRRGSQAALSLVLRPSPSPGRAAPGSR